MTNSIVTSSYTATMLSLIFTVSTLLNSSPLFVRADWIDPDTPESAHTTRPRYIPLPPVPRQPEPKNDEDHVKTKHRQETMEPSQSPTPPPTQNPTMSPTTLLDPNDNRVFKLVMSDEFNVEGRTFKDGEDPKWTAMDKNDYTNGALHYYSPDNVFTKNGDLVIKSEAEHVDFVGFNDTTGKNSVDRKNFKSAMLQSWNKFCFTGGIIEAEIEQPGKAQVGGLWPAFWLLGNIARHTYVQSTALVWPWSTNVCTPYSRSTQKINGCLKSQHYGLQKSFGRGAPEIDIFEVQAGPTKANTDDFLMSPVGQPFMSSSYQVAPGRPENRPGSGWWPGPDQWYNGLHGGTNSSLNIFFYGVYNSFGHGKSDYWSDAISYNHQLRDSHFENKYRYRVEWELPDEDLGHDGWIRWFVNDKFVLQVNGTGLVEAGLGSEISTEPMYIIMNTAISDQWGFPHKCPANCDCSQFDCLSKKFQETCGFQKGFCDMMTNKTDLPKYKVNYVRVYQNQDDPKQKVGCSTPERPTRKYIQAHKKLYMKEGDKMPLLPVPKGTGTCKRDVEGVSADTCGGPTRGLCSAARKCECRSGWTGPHCLANEAFDPVQYDIDDGFADLEIVGPMAMWSGLYIGLAVIGVLGLFAPTIKRRMDGWKPIP